MKTVILRCCLVLSCLIMATSCLHNGTSAIAGSGVSICKNGIACPVGAHCVDGECACDDPTFISVPCACLDPNDPHNCGSIGNECPSGTACVNGVCTCPNGTPVCNGQCINPSTDPENCGTCGRACPASNPNCCNGVCTNLDTNPNNCGSCGIVCPTGLCVGGTCATPCDPSGNCPAGQTCCGGICVTLSTDPNNCGTCGNQCPSGECVNGDCVPLPCNPTTGACSDPIMTCCNGFCVFEASDPNNCGQCGFQCGESTPNCCSGVCANLNSNIDNCGTCGNACDEPDNACCSGVCANTQTDINNCGDCGNACDDPDNACCSGVCANTQTDTNNCGTCGNVCGDGDICQDGACVSGLVASNNNSGMSKDGLEALNQTTNPSVTIAANESIAKVEAIGEVIVIEPMLASAMKYYSPFQKSLIGETSLCDNEFRVAFQWDAIANPTLDQIIVLDALDALPASALPDALDAMSGEQHTYFIGIDMFVDRRFSRRVFDSLRNLLLPCTCAPDCGIQTWLTVEGGQAFAKGNHCHGKGFKSSYWDISLGAHTVILPSFIVGLAGNYEEDFIKFKRDGGRNTLHTGQGAIYGAYSNECFYVFSDLILGYGQSRFKRHVLFGTIDRHAHSKPQGFHLRGYAEVGMNFEFCNVIAQPFIGFDGGYYRVNHIKEKGADSLNLDIHARKAESWSSFLGAHLTADFCCVNVSFDAAWQHRFEQFRSVKDIFAKFDQTCPGAIIEGSSPERNGFLGDIYFAVPLCGCFELYGELSGEVWEDWTDYGFNAGIAAWW